MSGVISELKINLKLAFVDPFHIQWMYPIFSLRSHFSYTQIMGTQHKSLKHHLRFPFYKSMENNLFKNFTTTDIVLQFTQTTFSIYDLCYNKYKRQ